jgi:signal transduction histidine kinase
VLAQVDIVTEISPDLPPLAGDRHEFEQALVNLLLNAASAMEGRGRVTIAARADAAVTLRQDANFRVGDAPGVHVDRDRQSRARAWLHRLGDSPRILTVTIADSGPGVPADDMERIFDPFFTTKAPGMGTGLGLAIVSRIVDSLGGVVWVRPAREGGAAFVMMFPVGVVPASRVQSPVAAPGGALVR